MSTEKEEFFDDDNVCDEEYSILEDEEYDEIDDLLYRAFIAKDIECLSSDLSEPQRLLFKKIVRRMMEMLLKREKMAFKKGLVEGWTFGKEEQRKDDH